MNIVAVYEILPGDGAQMPLFLDVDKMSKEGCKDAKKYARAISKAIKNKTDALVDDELMLCWSNWEYESYEQNFPCTVSYKVTVHPKEE